MYTHTHTHTHKCEYLYITFFLKYNCVTELVHTDREVTANRPDIIIKNKKRKHANP